MCDKAIHADSQALKAKAKSESIQPDLANRPVDAVANYTPVA
jgi:hypothetical protein